MADLVPALLTAEELVEVAIRGRCRCSHLRVFHDPWVHCFGGEPDFDLRCSAEGCNCLDFDPEPTPTR